jgi:hypothetical protein
MILLENLLPSRCHRAQLEFSSLEDGMKIVYEKVTAAAASYKLLPFILKLMHLGLIPRLCAFPKLSSFSFFFLNKHSFEDS